MGRFGKNVFAKILKKISIFPISASLISLLNFSLYEVTFGWFFRIETPKRKFINPPSLLDDFFGKIFNA